MRNVWVVIPALNEVATIGDLIAQLRAAGYGVVVVDDGSTDDTGAAAIAAGAVVVRHDAPYGIARACLDGWRMALQYQPTEVIQMDAGGSHDPAAIVAMLAALDHADMVIGSRFANGGEYIGGGRRFGSQLAARMMNFAAGKRAKFSDWTSGYRAWNADALRKLANIAYAQRMHAWQIEVLARAVVRKMRIVEVGITYRAGTSSFKSSMALDAFGEWLWLLLT
jgi:glycosyltransferase involved in cell wall biosynthesis